MRRSYASAFLGVIILSVSLSVLLSVCLSVCHKHALWQNQTIHCGYFDSKWNVKFLPRPVDISSAVTSVFAFLLKCHGDNVFSCIYLSVCLSCLCSNFHLATSFLVHRYILWISRSGHVSRSTVKVTWAQNRICECNYWWVVSLWLQELVRRWDTWTWRNLSSYIVTYLPLNYK